MPSLWLTCLAAGCRTAVACSIIAAATVYGPVFLRRHVTFPAFSYVTAILIVTNATLGDTVHGCWLALYATLQTVCPAMAVFWLIGPSKFSYETIALTVALASIVVVLPSSSHVLAKRIALGQIVIIYVVGFIGGVQTHPLMHPVHVASTTAMGVAASLLATLLPFPRLASLEVKEKSKAMVDNVAERLRLLVKAFLADNDTVAAGSLSKASLLSTSATKILQPIKQYQESMQWEWIPLKMFKLGWLSSSQKLQDLERPIRGMELALSNIPSYPIEPFQNEALQKGINTLENHIIQSLNQGIAYQPSDSHTFPESNPDEDPINTLHSIQIINPTNHKNLPSLFFIFCMKLLQQKSQNNNKLPNPKNSKQQEEKPNQTKWAIPSAIWNSKKVMGALKSAISLGIAVYLGLIYSKENGFWASLGVAVSIACTREATFKVANVKLQGTVIGSVYGVLCFVIFEKFLLGRLLCLLPCFVFTSFLQRSKMYGPAGGVSAIIGAVIILGRTNYGSPKELALARIVETIIGVSSSIMVDIILHPTRASKLAKFQLTSTLRELQKCINSTSFRPDDLKESLKELGMHVGELKKLIDEAEIEPNFWFLPFPSGCYGKLFKSLSKMVDLFGFLSCSVEGVRRNLPVVVLEDSTWVKVGENLEEDVEDFKEMVSGLVRCCVDVSSLKSLEVLEKEVEKRNGEDDCGDVEMGEGKRVIEIEEMEKEKLVCSFMQHYVEVVEQSGESEEGKREALLSFSALAFCLSSLMKEIEEIGKATRELIQWENPSSHVDFNEITCKIHAVQKGVK
ncbi:uncharacterized protein LOC120083972 [Benincasa hispida]|uniref:uncharacterized protein LOC120083972 n=1 Tax=Benincasa hispida TaxID=102211 RepID=UPI0019018F81|nr:uncharacterized protein LOC120083972 [Benincasa hispida]